MFVLPTPSCVLGAVEVNVSEYAVWIRQLAEGSMGLPRVLKVATKGNGVGKAMLLQQSPEQKLLPCTETWKVYIKFVAHTWNLF